MEHLWSLYHFEIPEFIKEFSNTIEMQRLKDVGMNCGCEYTNLKEFTMRHSYSRYDHSVSVALIIWHFTRDMKQTIAGLFHDIATPVFAHVIDFLNEDYINQESTEDYTEDIIMNSKQIMTLLEKYHIKVEEVCDYHMYPIADNDSPKLSADRLEYTLGNLYNYGFCELNDIQKYYNDLIVDTNEYNEKEIQFKIKDIAYEFFTKAFQTFEIYVSTSDRFSMQCLADVVKYAVNKGVIDKKDLYSVETKVIAQLENDQQCRKLWNQYKNYSKVYILQQKREDCYCVNVDAKRRYFDPIANKERLSNQYKDIKDKIIEFVNRDFNYWIGAE